MDKSLAQIKEDIINSLTLNGVDSEIAEIITDDTVSSMLDWFEYVSIRPFMEIKKGK